MVRSIDLHEFFKSFSPKPAETRVTLVRDPEAGALEIRWTFASRYGTTKTHKAIATPAVFAGGVYDLTTFAAPHGEYMQALYEGGLQ